MAPIQPQKRTLSRSRRDSSRQHPHKPHASKGSPLGVIKSLFTGTGKATHQARLRLRGGASGPFELAPKTRAESDAGDGEPPSSFLTELGPRRVPRRRYPLPLSPEMIMSVRQGILSKFLRNGKYLSASDLGDMVDPQTAILGLDETYYFETMQLAGEEEQLNEDQKATANLFYISVNADELPSYHFWQAEGDVNPMAAPMYFDWGDYFSKNLPNAQFETFEKDVLKQRREQNEVQGHTLTGNDTHAVPNAWAPGGEFYRRFNPKKGFRVSTVEVIEPVWDKQGTIAGLPYNSSRHGTVDNSRQSGPQPGDEEWERIETGLEELLNQKGLRGFMADYKVQNSEGFEALKYGPKSPTTRPSFGSDPDTNLFNDVLRTGVPTVAFKLTQQHFGRPVSPINGQEPLIRGQDPKHWVRDPSSMEDVTRTYGGLVMHQEEELEFLDFYNEKAFGKIMIRSRKPIPEQYIRREEPYRARVLDDLADNQPETVDKPADLGKGLQNAFALSRDPFGEGSEAAEKPGANTSKTSSGSRTKTAHQPTQPKASSKTPLQSQANASGGTEKDEDSRNKVSVAKDGTEGATHLLRLVRAGRSNVEEVQQPATVYDVRAFFGAAARLYPNLTFNAIGIRVTTQDEFNKAEVTPAIIEELATDSLRWHHLVTNIFPSAEVVYVIPAYEYLEVFDPRIDALNTGPVRWNIGGALNASNVKASFEKLCGELLGTDRLWGSAASGMVISVALHPEEKFQWTQKTSKAQFVQDLFYRIDHPNINVLPVDLKSAEQQGQSVEGAGDGSKQGLRLEPDSGENQEHERLFNQKLRDLETKMEARHEPETVYGGLDDDITLPRWGPSREHQIRGGSDLPSLITRVPTVLEIERDQRYRNLIENELLQREEFCRVCRQTFRHGDDTAIQNHYRQHSDAEVWLCPFCTRNFTEHTTEARTEHIATAHPMTAQQPAYGHCPWADCSEHFTQGDQYPDWEAVVQHLGDHWREYDAALRADKCPVVPCSAGLAYMSDVEREEHEEWHRDRGDTGAVPDDGPSGDGGSGDGGSGKGGSSKGGFGKLSSGKGGSGKGGSGKGGSGKGGSDTGGSNNQDSVGDTPPDEGSPPPKPEDLQGESEDLNNEDEEEEQPTQEPENQPEQPEGTESENDDDQPPIPPSQPTKTTGTKKGKPTVQCCAVCFTQLKSLKGATLDRHFNRCGNQAKTTINIDPTTAKQRKQNFEQQLKANPGRAAGNQNRKVRWEGDLYDKLSAPAVGHERKRQRMALVEVQQHSQKRSRH